MFVCIKVAYGWFSEVCSWWIRKGERTDDDCFSFLPEPFSDESDRRISYDDGSVETSF